MTNQPPEDFTCPHCGTPTSWVTPGMGSFLVADLLATLVALPFLVFGVIGFVLAVCGAAVALMYFFHQSSPCRNCGRRISRAQAEAGGA